MVARVAAEGKVRGLGPGRPSASYSPVTYSPGMRPVQQRGILGSLLGVPPERGRHPQSFSDRSERGPARAFSH
jgi:hypothetical protein